ncbi:MAG: DNA repair protein RadC [Treponema sp.]|uniref:RadC family protein n=1 Tax=Treponema sp. TaxID=166 RepID=UPI001DB4DBAB|nr:DNA repair protein RadC [Treponema sp.]MBS7309711.1 DNA repair protein RadC [Treponema sp.]MCI5696205.1 DNA repair protein RadC [Spirochaetia bacterium]MDY5885200.1 DNA repair protein RadC [Treponema sp.]
MNIPTKPDLRERVLSRGIKYPTDEELVMLIIGSGSKEDNVETLSEKITQIVDCSQPEKLIEKLLRIKGVGHSKALAVAAALEFGRRRTSHLEAKVRCPNDIIPYLQVYAIKPQEHFITVCLNGAHEILNINVISVGSGNRTLVQPREIFTEAIKRQASAIIICHNHPSGSCKPSPDDIETTRRLINGASILGIALLDHIIITKTSHFSFLENKLLFTDSANLDFFDDKII